MPGKIYSKTISILLMSVATMFVINSCKHEPIVSPSITVTTPVNPDTVGGGNAIVHPCSADTVYFLNDVLPLFVSNCAMSGCHDATTHKEGIILNSYSSIINSGKIQGFNLNHGKIYKVITETNTGDRMPPPPASALSQAQINMIAQWINQGALNNSCDECDTSNVTYSSTIAPLLQLKCVGCHNGSVTSGNVNLSSYPGAQSVALNGRLYGAIHRSTGFIAMPPGGTSLPDCDVRQISIWIQNGALNN